MHFDLCNSQIDLGPWDHPRIQLVQLIDCGFALALLEDKQFLAREDCNVP